MKGSASQRGWQNPMKPILASHIRVPLLDLLLFRCGRRFGVETSGWMRRRSQARCALANLQLAHLTIVYFGLVRFRLGIVRGEAATAVLTIASSRG
jgi:hypothetical protein